MMLHEDMTSSATRVVHEVEVHPDAALASLDKFVICPKTSAKPTHHSTFISVDNFSEHQLLLQPDLEFLRKDFFNYIKSQLPLVVRIHGHFISEDRPDTKEDGTPYLFSHRKGEPMYSAGTGWVVSVRAVDDTDRATSDNYTQHREACHRCTLYEGNVWHISVKTTRHLIFDLKEARQCDIVFFHHHDHDSGSRSVCSGSMGSGLVSSGSVDSGSVGSGSVGSGPVGSGSVCVSDLCTDKVVANTFRDRSFIYFYTKDADLVARLLTAEKDVKIKKRLLDELIEQHPLEWRVSPAGLPVVVVGYPHGGKLYISCGTCSREKEDEDGTTLLYHTSTCEGCSGAIVLYFNQRIYRHCHSGVLEGLGASTTIL